MIKRTNLQLSQQEIDNALSKLSEMISKEDLCTRNLPEIDEFRELPHFNEFRELPQPKETEELPRKPGFIISHIKNVVKALSEINYEEDSEEDSPYKNTGYFPNYPVD